MSLENEIALVTGASRGIGAAIADGLAEAGAKVIGTATSEAGAQAIKARIQGAGREGSGMVLNVADQASIDNLIQTLSEAFGNPTILVNNAGITRDNLLMRMKDDEWESIINTNLSSVYRLSKAVLRGMMKARKGRIINISSVVGVMGNAGQTNYAAAKAGIHGFTRSLAREVGSRGITVNSVAPGFIETDMTKELPEAQRKSLEAAIPLQKMGQPEDIASAVLFLAGESGRYITGETLHVNGGMYMC
ncbi:MAG: 3-oxoacyl-ACP reductase FabG [Candidatus Thiodiazotropha sp. (ex Dulcina madagascariensis)]|nr:3-oxoacyl-ACP reductase FabG [Candidatus Thiodiazotropha sp. (ex Epidulcina cf. delphinae)]MCU7923622.1 3-oxoacyl-ACP reductase FabG [Candidatus Thiodiazotropha sp. (ex Dulcina madagascariensis)]MCU7926263.1 3-oxoacyl-ACP reductase FabG [Candidatus Thiodiazotropha sp. (ex Dulcina madagascariensis)]